ncbi:Actin- protein 6 [Blastocladiella emersonii ATCC 22665]|nr:Actin- protein 6 [Blastocladiella emersonii ATCC 22665]
MVATLILDNGAHAIKAALHLAQSPVRGTVDRRVLVADEADKLNNVSGILYRVPFERGFLVNWEAQKVIWDRVFAEENLGIDPTTTRLVLTEPVFNPPSIQNAYDVMVFEAYRFASYVRLTAPQAATYSREIKLSECHLIVDVGYSFTNVVPFANHKPIDKAIQRINVGGKLMTNVLKETISFRHYNMLNETYLVNVIKETTCFVSDDVDRDLAICQDAMYDRARNPLLALYVLPDGTNQLAGRVKAPDENISADEQVLPMNHERFMVPEVLFNPSDIGIEQCGIAEAIVQAVTACPEEMRELMYDNLIVIGGCAALPGFEARLTDELRSLAPAEHAIHITVPADPATFAAKAAASIPAAVLDTLTVTRKEYLAAGSQIWRTRGLAREIPAHLVPSEDLRGGAGESTGRSRKSTATSYAESSDDEDDDSDDDDDMDVDEAGPRSRRGRASRTK